jgi:hypothetical protein
MLARTVSEYMAPQFTGNLLRFGSWNGASMDADEELDSDGEEDNIEPVLGI